MLHKNGSPKEANATLEFMRRVAQIREEVRATASDNATERVELDEEDVSELLQSFQIGFFDMLTVAGKCYRTCSPTADMRSSLGLGSCLYFFCLDSIA